MDTTLSWLRDSALGQAMRESPDLFPTCETFHFIGLSLLIGAMLAVDLRIMGWFSQTSYRSVLMLLPLAIVGFVINLVTGICFIASNPELYFTNPAFNLKLVLIAVAGANALWFTFAEHRKISDLDAAEPAPALARYMAGGSLAIWMLVLILGRMLPTFAPIGGG